MKRSRGRGRRPQNSHGGHNHNYSNNNNNHNRSFDSNGPDIKIRGTAANVYEKYLQMARDANAQGDRVQAESYLQHAEHYYRIMMAAMPQGGQPVQGGQVQGQGQGQMQQGQMPGQMQGQGQSPGQVQGQPGMENGQVNGNDQYNQRGSTPSFSMNEEEGMDDEEAGPAI